MRPAGGWRSCVGNEAQPEGYVPPACFAAPRSQDRQQLVLSRVEFLAGGRERHGQWRYFQEGHDRWIMEPKRGHKMDKEQWKVPENPRSRQSVNKTKNPVMSYGSRWNVLENLEVEVRK